MGRHRKGDDTVVDLKAGEKGSWYQKEMLDEGQGLDGRTTNFQRGDRKQHKGKELWRRQGVDIN